MDFSSASFMCARKSDCVTNCTSHYHNHYELNFLTSGNTRMQIGEMDIEYNSFDFLLIPPGVTHLLYDSKYDRFDNYVIWFELKDKQKIGENDKKAIKLHDSYGAVKFLCSEIYRLYTQSKHEEDELSNIYLQGVLYHMKRGMVLDVSKHLPREDELLDAAVKYINSNIFDKYVHVADVADELNISPSYLTRIFNRKLSISPMRYINEVKVSSAKELLRTCNKTIKEIASDLHFSDPLYFSRIFSSLEGMSPREYRKVGQEIEEIGVNNSCF